MKKFILILLFGVLMSTLVNADCGIMMYKDYKAIVSNENGAATYEYNYNEAQKEYEYKKKELVVPYGEEISIIVDTYKTENDYFLRIEYSGEEYDVKASDLKNIEDFENNNIQLEKSEYYVYEDTEVRKGPGILYEVVGTIKADTNIYVDFLDNNGNEGGIEKEGGWIYISDGTTSGYIYNDMCYVAHPLSICKKVETNDYYYLGTDDKGIGLKFGDKITPKYYAQEALGITYYIKYNDKYIRLYDSEVGKESNESFRILSLENIPANIRELESPDKELIIEDYLKIGDNYNIIYETYDNYFAYYYVKIDEKIYIVTLYTYPIDEYILFFDKEESKNEEIKNEDIIEVDSITVGIETKDNEKNSGNEEEIIIVDGISSKEDVIIFLCGAIILSAVTCIVIVLINKRKKK